MINYKRVTYNKDIKNRLFIKVFLLYKRISVAIAIVSTGQIDKMIL